MDEWKADESADEYSTARWESYSDLMAVMLMVFALILSAIMLVSAQESVQSEARQTELAEWRREAQDRMGVRRQIIEALRTSLADYQVEVDASTGAIRIGAAVLFAQDDTLVSDRGKAVLRDVMSTYTEVLLNTEFQQFLSRIIVEGHTNSDGPRGNVYLYNLHLSQSRARNVLRQIVRSYRGTRWESALKSYMVASAR